MTAFLQDYFWEVIIDSEHFFHVKSVFFVNSYCIDITNLHEDVILIPQSHINDLHKLDNVDYDVINQNNIPILKCENNIWSIDLSYYDSFLQPSSS